MSIIIHIIISLILAAVLSVYFGWYSLLVLIGGVLIDIDHYLSYAVRSKRINIFRGYTYFKEISAKKKWLFGILCVFHSFELLFILTVLSFFSKEILVVTIGFVVHYLLDFIYEYRLGGRLIKNWSWILWARKKI